MEQHNNVRGLVSNIVTPKVYDDIVYISQKDENIRRIQSSSQGSQLYWELNSLTCNSFLDRKIALEFTAVATVRVGANEAARPFTAGNIYSVYEKMALKFSPILSNATNIEISINNQKISYPANVFYEPLSRFENGDIDESMRLSECPQYHDYGSYNPIGTDQGLEGAVGFDNFTINGLYNPRGNILPTTVADGAAALSSVVTYNWTEFLYLPPLTTFDDLSGFYDINSIAISISLPADMTKILSLSSGLRTAIANGANGSVAVAQLVQSAQQMRLYTVTSPFDCPRTFAQMLPAYNVTRVTTTASANTAPLAVVQNVTSNNVSLSKIPSRIAIYVNRANENITYADANTYGVITNLKLTFGNRSDYFQYYNDYDLWKRLVNMKGNKIPWKIYRNTCGSPLLIEPDKDIYDCPPAGSPCCSNMQVTVSFQSLYPGNTDFQLIILPIYDSVLSYTRNTFTINDLIIDGKAVTERARQEYYDIPQSIPKSLCKIGGSFKDDVINGIGKVLGGIDAALKFYRQNKEIIDPIIEAAKDAGLTAIEVASMLFGGGLHPNEVYSKLSMFYPESELAPLFRNLKEAGCCCDYEVNWPVEKAGAMKKKPTKKGKKGGVMIEVEDDFDRSRPRVSLRDRS